MSSPRLLLKENTSDSEREYIFLEYNPNIVEFFVVTIVRKGNDYNETKENLDVFRDRASDSDKNLLSKTIQEVFRP